MSEAKRNLDSEMERCFMKKLLIAALAVATLLPVSGAARVFVAFQPALAYRPYWNAGPYYRPYPVAPHAVTGAVKFDTSEKSANVFVNHSFAGTVADVKTLHLKPGTYEIELSEAGHTSFREKVYVAPDHTLKLHPVLPVLPAEGSR